MHILTLHDTNGTPFISKIVRGCGQLYAGSSMTEAKCKLRHLVLLGVILSVFVRRSDTLQYCTNGGDISGFLLRMCLHAAPMGGGLNLVWPTPPHQSSPTSV